MVLSTRTDASSPVFGKTDLSLAIPLQTIPLAELAGAWNALEHFRDPLYGQPLLAPSRYTITFDAAGTPTVCDANDCTQYGPDEALRANPAGGFLVGAEDPVEGPSWVYAFRGVDGQLSMFLSYSNRRGIVMLSKQSPLTLPAVGDTARFWDFSVGSDGYGLAPRTELTTTVTAVDAAAGSYRSSRASDGRIDTFTVNDPQAGLRSRNVNDCTTNGAAVACASVVSMPLPGTGISVYASGDYFGITVDQP